MLAVQEIEKEILSLEKKDYSTLRNWFYTKDLENWDKEIEEDSISGKLDYLINEAISEKNLNQLKNL